MFNRENRTLKRYTAFQCLAFLLTLLLLEFPAQAAHEKILAHNLELSQQWVNWYPGETASSEAVETFARQLLLQAGSREAAPRIIHDWICQNIFYDWDSFDAGVYGTLLPEDVLETRRGVCESVSNLMQAMCLAVHVPCIKVWGVCVEEGAGQEERLSAQNQVNHTWNELYIDGRWITVDCTMDMKNGYRDGTYTVAACADDFFDPEESFFAQTHKRLRRGFDLPENIPAGWALPALRDAVNQDGVPLRLFSHYASPISRKDFLLLLGQSSEEDVPLRRAEAAVLLAAWRDDLVADPSPFLDTAGCTSEEQAAIAGLYQRGVMVGTSSDTFSPEDYLTRQEAILIWVRLQEETKCT